MAGAGFMGKVLFVDLSTEEIEITDLNLDAAKRFLGGLGLNAWLMAQNYTIGTHPLSPSNPIILGTGPLVGTGCPGTAKIIATTRFPINGAISESVGSMRFARNLKGAGFDHVVIMGKAKRPVILEIKDGHGYLHDASRVWGLDTFATTDAVKKYYSGPKSGVIAIGPAGENRVAFSLAIIDKASTLGRGGLGAVMGSKNLKAIAASGNARPQIYDKSAFDQILGGIRDRLKRFKNHPRVLEFGIMENWNNYIKQFSSYRNFTQVFPHDRADKLYGIDTYKSFRTKRFGCPSCFTPDKEILEVVSGPYKGFKTSTTSYFNSFSVGHLFDLNTAEDKTAAVRMADTLDRLGLDMLTFSTMLDFLITESEYGNLDKNRFHIPLKRDMATLVAWAESLSTLKGPSEVLANGWGPLLNNLEQDIDSRAPVIKNCDVMWEPRLVGLGTLEFEQIVSLKGPRSASGGSPTYIPGQPEENLQLFRRHLDRMGADSKAIDRVMDSPLGFNVGRMTRYSEDWYTILSSLGICNRHFNNRFYSLESCHKLFEAVTGMGTDLQDLRDSAALIWDTLKTLNVKEGFGPEDDRPPKIWFRPMIGPNGEQFKIRDYFGQRELTEQDVKTFVDDYYDERGWKGQPEFFPQNNS